jgi:hypothetical protein
MAEDKEGCLGAFLGLFFLAYFAWTWVSDTKLRYAVQYGINTDQVTIATEPADCDFMHAPLGQKDCHYEKTVLVIKRGTDTKSSRPIISYDEGRTWNWDDGDTAPRGTSVSVFWVKSTS